MKFASELLTDLVLGGDVEGFEVIEQEICHRDRWSVGTQMVFKHDNTFYSVTYQEGATEYQDVERWVEIDGMVECTEVVPVEVTTIVYREKNRE